MKKLFCVAAVVGSMLAMFTGCVATPLPPVDTRVTLAPNLGATVHVTDVRCAKTAGSDYLTMQANVVNNTDRERRVQWKVQWLDINGIEIESLASSWDALALQPFELKGLKAVAPRTDAVDMRLYVRALNR